MKKTLAILASLLVLIGYSQTNHRMDGKELISQAVVVELIDNLIEEHGEKFRLRIERGVNQAATLMPVKHAL